VLVHRVIVSLGSNISPKENIRRAVELLSAEIEVQKLGSTWETAPVGTTGENFYNTALLATTNLQPDDLKYQVFRPIEFRLGRVRTDDKYAPRQIDLDAILFDDEILDTRLWTYAYLALPIADLCPELRHPRTGQSLKDVAADLLKLGSATLVPGLFT
jgi:2-amino-4-hydroxy-6-hydroxymethyldihydropteridine diphosphokinase